MTRHILITVSLWLYALSAFSTAQIPDKIIYKGKEYKLFSNPLEAYFDQYPDKRPQNGMISTALWRGYVATFEVEDNQLFLKDIEVEYQSDKDQKLKWKSVLNEVFPDQKKIKIDWMTGLLVIPQGKLTNYVHMGYASTYEKYILLEINEGNIAQERKLKGNEYEKFKDTQFKAFKKTEEYKKLVRDMKERDPMGTDEFIDSFLRIYVIDYSTKILEE